MKIRYLSVAGAMMMASTVAMAGLTSPQPVAVTVNADMSGSATGAMTSARFTANRVEYIGCGVRYYASGSSVYRYGWCQAANSAGTSVFCSVDGTDLLDAIVGLANYSYITFGWDAAGNCTRIGYSTQSMYIP